MEQTRTFTLPENLTSALLNYLSSRPHGEVNKLITALANEVQKQLTPAERVQAGLAPATTPQLVTTPATSAGTNA